MKTEIVNQRKHDMTTQNTPGPRMGLREMGTTGLVRYAVTGSKRLRGARIARARKIIAERYRSFAACCLFINACNDAVLLKERWNHRQAEGVSE